MSCARNKTRDGISHMHNNVHDNDMTDPNILDSEAYLYMFSEFEKSIEQGPTYICNICWTFVYRTDVICLVPDKYSIHNDMFTKCKTNCKSLDNKEYICNSCDHSLKKGKMPSQAQINGMHLNTIYDAIDDLCPLELSLVSQITPFMFIVPRHRGAQHGLKGQVVLVPSDLKKDTQISASKL